MSTPGKHDGLVWRNPDRTLGGPRADELADALAEGYTDHSKPFHGYYFKILKGQGPAAPLGKMDFVIEGAMIGASHSWLPRQIIGSLASKLSSLVTKASSIRRT